MIARLPKYISINTKVTFECIFPWYFFMYFFINPQNTWHTILSKWRCGYSNSKKQKFTPIKALKIQNKH